MIEVVRNFTVPATKVFLDRTRREFVATILNKSGLDVEGVASYRVLEPPPQIPTYFYELVMDTSKPVSFPKLSATEVSNSITYRLVPRKDIKYGHTLRVALNLNAGGQVFDVEYKAIVNTPGYSTDEVTNDPKQQKIYYIDGLYWFFFSDGMDLLYTVSSNGVVWTPPTVIDTPLLMLQGFRFDTFFDGTYLHIAILSTDIITGFSDIYYRRFIPVGGTLQRDPPGDPAWYFISTVESQTISITTDTNGYPWIAYEDIDASMVVVTKSSTNDGTWVTDTGNGFPYEFPAYGNSRVTVRRLTGGKVLFHWNDEQFDIDTANLNVKVWDGTSWSPTATFSITPSRGTPSYNVITREDDAFIQYNRDLYKYSFANNDINLISTIVPGDEVVDGLDLGMTTYDTVGDKIYITWLTDQRSTIRRRVYHPASDTLDEPYTVANLSRRPSGRCRPTVSHSLVNGKIGFAYNYTDDIGAVYHEAFVTEP
jgi:hypothetical protein